MERTNERFPNDCSKMKEIYVFTTGISVKANSLKEAVRIFYDGMSRPWVHDNIVERVEDGNGDVDEDGDELVAAMKAWYGA